MAKGWRRVAIIAVVSAILVSACQSGNNSTSTTRVAGGDVRFALLPGSPPNYIFPMAPPQFDINVNFIDFIWMMYRPLYWYGQGANDGPFVNPDLSVGNPPTWSSDGLTATIKLKSYMWSDGTPITSRDIEFWINLLMANKASYGNYVPGTIPDNIASVSYPDASTFTITFKQAYSQYWLLYNQLALLWPAPQHVWDKTSASSAIGDYDRTPQGAVAVFNYLDKESQTLGTYNTNPLWQVVNGPWRLEPGDGFEPSTGHTILVPNPKYSGPNKPTIAKFELVPFTTDTAEFNALQSGAVDYGYIPFQDISQVSNLTNKGYTVKRWIGWQVNYIVINFTNPKTGSLFKQLYIRQALQDFVNQPSIIKNIYAGYAHPDYGPVPQEPPTDYLSAAERQNPYPYDPAAAKKLLQDHGWNVVPNGVSTCANAGSGANQCGPGIQAGTKLELSLQYASGAITVDQQMQQYKSDLSQIGVSVNLGQQPFNAIFAVSVPCDPSTNTGCAWDLVYWGGAGWTFAGTDTYPEGGQIFETGAGANSGGYSDPTADQLMTASQVQGPPQLGPYEDYLAKQLPVLWVPVPDSQISAWSPKLHGVVQGTMLHPYPEYWYLTQ
jgi:peptide/nickel transport system substrate-binding protein